MRCYLFDLDGTLADLSHRLHHIKPDFDAGGLLPVQNWRAFFAACSDDAPIEHICELARALHLFADIVVVSGRSDECAKATREWLEKNGVTYAALYTRKEGDHRPDHIVKSELLVQILADGYEPIMAFEDRDQVVRMWRERGIPCAQVADGAF